MKTINKRREIKTFYNNHKEEIYIGTTAILIGGLMYLGVKNHQQGNLIKSLNAAGVAKDNRINDLINLCLEKDEYYKKMMSEAFRHGSSEGARQMAYRRWL